MHSDSPSAERPLAGVRVLDLSRLLPGPFATMVLGDLGAQVDKLEDPRGGDYLRFMPPREGKALNSVFELLNRGKRSAVLDLKTDAGREAFLALITHYDVLVESFRPGVLERLGLGNEALWAVNPRLVVCAISGYGATGPLAQRAGHDLNYLARAGVLGLTGPNDGPPQVPGVQVADIGGALYSVIGILAALRARDATGRGSAVDIAMCEAAASFATFGLAVHAGGLSEPRGRGVLSGGIAPYGTYATKDGRHVALAALEPKFWSAFCEGVGIQGRPDALVPGAHQAKWTAELESLFASRTFAEWREFADRVDCCLEPVLLPEELESDPQHVARGLFAGGALRMRTPAGPATEGAAPTQGQHTDEILSE